MGLFVILPFLGLCAWILWTTFLRLKMEIFDSGWRRSFLRLALFGAALGLWTGIRLRYHPAPTVELKGFPFPIEITHFKDGRSDTTTLPLIIRCAGISTNLLFAAMVATLPVTISSYLLDWKRRGNQPE